MNMIVTEVTFPEMKWKTYVLQKEVTIRKGWTWSFSFMDNSVSFFNSKGRLVKTVKTKMSADTSPLPSQK